MAKKSFSRGIDNLIQSTVEQPAEPATIPMVTARPVTSTRRGVNAAAIAAAAEGSDITAVYVRFPVSLKIQLDSYCAQHRISRQQFITDLVRNAI
jgi:hypothetical protein